MYQPMGHPPARCRRHDWDAGEGMKITESVYRQIVESAADGIWIVDGDGETAFANPAMAGMLGYDAQELEGKSLFDFMDEEGRELAADNLERVHKGALKNCDLKFRRKDGSDMWAIISASSICGAKGGQEQSLDIITDITARHRMEKALLASETRYRRLFEAARDAILILDAQTGRIDEANKCSIELLGYPPGELLGKRLWETGAFRDASAARRAFSELQARGYIRCENMPLAAKDGRLIEAEVVSSVYEVDRKKVAQCNIRDITERGRMESALRASESQYRSMIDAMDDAIAVVDPDLQYVRTNRAFKMMHLPAGCGAGVTGRRMAADSEVLPAGFAAICRKVFADGKTIVKEDICRHGDREDILEVRVIPLSSGGLVHRVVVMLRDITQRRQIERFKDEFSAIAAHELRNPISAISASIQAVLDRQYGEITRQQREFLRIALRGTDRLEKLLKNILAVCRLEAGVPASRERADIVGLAREVVAAFKAKAELRNIKLLEVFSPARIELFLEKEGMTEVFTNLVNNALKFTEKGHIEVVVLDRGDRVECSVCDTGVGIPEKDLHLVFDKFKQFKVPVDIEEKGSGLGLYIVKEIIERHKGTITVSSICGKGTRFTFVLPKTGTEKHSTGY